MKKIFAMVLALTMLFSLTACQGEKAEEMKMEKEEKQSSSNEESEEAKVGEKLTGKMEKTEKKQPISGVKIANPFLTFDNLEDAEKEAGFSVTLPEAPSWVTEKLYRPKTDKSMLEVIYWDGKDEIRIRKGTGNKDISGIYDDFQNEEKVQQDNKEITLKGDGNNFQMALWQDGDYSYFIRVSKGADKDEMLSLIKEIK